LNIEYRTRNIECRSEFLVLSTFDIPCSIFDIQFLEPELYDIIRVIQLVIFIHAA
jgi:hypothetical protein